MMRTLSIRLVPESAQAELLFRYPEIVAVIRTLRERRWHPERRSWTVARSEIDGLCRELERRGVHVSVHGAAAETTANNAVDAGRAADADAALGGHTARHESRQSTLGSGGTLWQSPATRRGHGRAGAMPTVLAVSEVKRLFAALANPKRRLMAFLLYYPDPYSHPAGKPHHAIDHHPDPGPVAAFEDATFALSVSRNHSGS